MGTVEQREEIWDERDGNPSQTSWVKATLYLQTAPFLPPFITLEELKTLCCFKWGYIWPFLVNIEIGSNSTLKRSKWIPKKHKNEHNKLHFQIPHKNHSNSKKCNYLTEIKNKKNTISSSPPECRPKLGVEIEMLHMTRNRLWNAVISMVLQRYRPWNLNPALENLEKERNTNIKNPRFFLLLLFFFFFCSCSSFSTQMIDEPQNPTTSSTTDCEKKLETGYTIWLTREGLDQETVKKKVILWKRFGD